MPDVIEAAPTGRAKCRGCSQNIAKGELRFGEAVPNPFADTEGATSTHWFHLRCAAFKRPEPLLPALAESPLTIEGRTALVSEAELGIAHRRAQRVDAAGRAPSGRASCRSCKAPIEKGSWRIGLVFYEDGRFTPSGYVHLRCVSPYIETTAILPRVRHFSPGLTSDDLAAIEAELGLI
jgi:Poly(ADP-ribose) polymerase and DNA-Ligase Zn-finger region